MKKMHFFLFVALLFSCKQVQIPQQVAEQIPAYPPTIMPVDTANLWVSDGEVEQETVLILLQGGPKDRLSFVDQGKSSWRYIPSYEQYYRVHLHQSTTFNPAIFEYTDEFSPEMAKKEVDNSSEMLSRAIKYFKDRNKTVYVLGHSFGAFIIPHYLATRPSLADKYFIISGRIDDNSVALEAHRQGYNGTYEDDGQRFVSDPESHLADYTENEKKYYRVKQWLKWAIGLPKYSEELAEVDLSNLTYIYYPKDSRVGRLTSEEINFLESKNAKVFSTNHEHGSSTRGLVDLIVDGEIEF